MLANFMSMEEETSIGENALTRLACGKAYGAYFFWLMIDMEDPTHCDEEYSFILCKYVSW